MCQEPTELLLIGCLTQLTWTLKFKSGTSTPNTRVLTYWRKEISHVTNGTIFFMCSTSAISALSAVPKNSAWSAAPKGWRQGCKNRKKKTGLWRNPGRRRWPWSVLFLQVLHLWTDENVELILRTIVPSISSVSTEQSQTCATNYAESEICEPLVIPIEIANTNTTSQSSCCKIISRNSQNFLKIRNCQDCAKMMVSWRRSRRDSSSLQLKKDLLLCRQHVENILNLEILRHLDQEDGFRSNTKIGPVLDVKLYPHEWRYCIDITTELSFRDQTASWIRIVNGINKNVTETSEEIHTEWEYWPVLQHGVTRGKG